MRWGCKKSAFMNKQVLSLALLLTVIACKPVAQEYDEYYGAGFIGVDEVLWSFEYATPYPFTVPYGEISCSYHPNIGREVWFAPKGYTDEKYIPTPLNQVAANSLKSSDMRSNVPYSVKDNVDLSTAISTGLNLCDEYQNLLNRRT